MLNPKSGRALAAILIAMFGIAVVASVVWGVTWLLAVLVAAIAAITFFAAESSQPTSTARQQSTATPPRYSPPPPPPPPHRRACSAPSATEPASAPSRWRTTAAFG
jgi:hypothetical protein